MCTVDNCTAKNYNATERCYRHRGTKWALISEPISEPISAAISEDISVSISENISENISEVISEAISEPISEPVKEAISEPVKEPVEEPVSETESSDMSDAASDVSEVESAVSEVESEVTGLTNTAKLSKCAEWLKDNSDNCEYHVEYRLKQKDSDAYMHDVKHAVVLRVEFAADKRRFYWIYNQKIAIAFAQFVGMKLLLEAHDIICSPCCRMFFDIDMKIDIIELDELSHHYGYRLDEARPLDAMHHVGNSLASMYIEAMKLSLEEHAVDDDDISKIDWMATMRNRPSGDKHKISIHIYTNLMLPIEKCKAFVEDMSDVIGSNADALGLDKSYVPTIAEAIDAAPYHRNGSLSMPFGYKAGHANVRSRDYAVPDQLYLLTKADQFTVTDIKLPGRQTQSNVSTNSSSPEFVQRALASVSAIPDWSNDTFTADTNSLRGVYLQTKRHKPSHCSVCDRSHDSDNTLKLIFNEAAGIAMWKCIRSKEKARVFYRDEPDTDDTDLDAFAKKSLVKVAKSHISMDDTGLEAFAKKSLVKVAKSRISMDDIEEPDDADAKAKVSKGKPKGKPNGKPKDKSKGKSKTSDDDDEPPPLQFPVFTRTFSGVPPMFDQKFDASYFKSVQLSKEKITMADAYDFVRNNIAYIQCGGNDFYLTKSRDEFGNIDYSHLKDLHKVSVVFKINNDIIYDDEGKITGQRELDAKNENDIVDIRFVRLNDVIGHYRNDITYDRVDFMPFSAKTGQYIRKIPSKQYDWGSSSVFNKFTGFVNEFDGNFVVDESKFETFNKHILEGWCDDDAALYDYTMKMFAWYVQKPFAKSGSCLVVESEEGSGKNIVSNVLSEYILGSKYCLETPAMKNLTGHFNAAREAKLLIVLNEAATTTRSSSADQEVLKDVITEESAMIERKGIDPYRVADRSNVIIFSNNSYSVKASTRLRRFVFYKMSNRFIGNKAHFDKIGAEFEDHGAGKHLYHYLMSIDISKFHPQNDAPLTDTKVEMRKMAIDKPVRFLIDWLNGDFVPDQSQALGNHEILPDSSCDKEVFITIDVLYSEFNQWLMKNRDGSAYTRDRFSKALTKPFGASERKRIESVGRLRGYTASVSKLKEMIGKHTGHADLFDTNDQDEDKKNDDE